MTPIFKKDDTSNVSNYRPISLLNTSEMFMEKFVHKHVFNFFLSNNKISNFQSGFFTGDSILNQLVNMYNTFCSGKEARAVFLDLSKPFDRVWHWGLLHKLNYVGIRGRLLDWFSDYLKTEDEESENTSATRYVLMYRFGKIVGKSNFSEQFLKLINRYKRIGYSLDIMRQTACLVVNPIIVDGYASLFSSGLRLNDGLFVKL